jgi:hypothetical protein
MELILREGFRPSSIIGYTSPEGPRPLPGAPPLPPGGFEGNNMLSQERADAAEKAFLKGVCLGCPTWGDRPIVPIGLSELYSPPPQRVRGRLREVEGDALARAAIDDAMTIDPLAPADTPAFRRQSLAAQRDQIYPLLRRAEITLERDPILVPASRGTPDRPGPAATVNCPANVIAAARRAFGLPPLP